MEKEKMLYVSPFPPQKSGISDYSKVLVYALKDYFDITLLTESYELSDERMYCDFCVAVSGISEIDFSEYKYIVYNIGNQPDYHSYIYELALEHPGLIIWHDLILYYLVVGYYEQKGELYSKLYQIGGTQAILKVKRELKKERKNLLEYKELAPLLPLNKELANSGNKIMVHSHYAERELQKIMEEPANVRKIDMICQTPPYEKDRKIEKHILFEKFGIPEDALIIASFGYIAATKLNHLVCEAVLNLAQKLSRRICYVMVGEGDYVNSYVDNEVIFKTDYTTLDEFNSFIAYADIVTNLRYPSMGETSAAMIRLMEYGKPSVIVDDAWFSELPKDCVVALEKDGLDRLESELEHLIQDEDYRTSLGKRAYQYVCEHHSPEVVCKEIINFCREMDKTLTE